MPGMCLLGFGVEVTGVGQLDTLGHSKLQIATNAVGQLDAARTCPKRVSVYTLGLCRSALVPEVPALELVPLARVTMVR